MHVLQCMFFDEDTKMFCEASSGAYGPQSATLRFELSHASDAALRQLGFTQTDQTKNHTREITLGTPPDYDIAAKLMLGALYDAYGVGIETQLAFKAPMAILPLRACPGPVRRP